MADNIYGDVPVDFQPQMQDISQQQKLAQMLLQQGMQQPQGQMISGHYVRPSVLQQLNPLFAAYAGSKGMETAENKQLELAKAIRTQGDIAAKDVMETYKQDPNAALQKALQYQQFPQVKAVLPQVTKTAMPETPVEQQGYNLAKSQGFPGTFLDYKLGIANAGAARTSLNVQNQLPFKEQIQKEAASGLMKNFETLQNVPSALANMDKMVALSKQPIYAGVGGETKLQIAKLFNNNFGTNISPETVKNTEEFKSAAYMGIMDNLKKTDSNPTMAQQNALKEAIGSLGTDPSAIPRVVNVMRDVLVNKATQHNELVRQTMQRGVEYPYSIEVQLPKSAPTQSGNVRSLADEILFRKPGAPR
jgi:hypothetical protein